MNTLETLGHKNAIKHKNVNLQSTLEKPLNPYIRGSQTFLYCDP